MHVPVMMEETLAALAVRPGGVWRFVMHGPDGRDYQNRVTFEEIVPPERIVYRHGGGDDVDRNGGRSGSGSRGGGGGGVLPPRVRRVP